MSEDFGRLMTAMVTAFDDEGRLDPERQSVVIEHLIATGTECLVVCGTTGESPVLKEEEKLKLFEHTLKTVDGRAKVIFGTGGNDTEDSVALTAVADRLQPDGFMLVTPYYNRPNQDGLYAHFKTVAAVTERPVMLYNVPARTGVNMTVETVCRLAEIPNIRMVKEASGDIGQMTQIIGQTPDDFLLYSGDDSLTIPAMAVGAHGVVSVAAHVLGKQMSEMIECFVQGNMAEAARWHRRLFEAFRAVFLAPSPAPVKKALQFNGIDAGPVRLPLVPLTREQEMQLLPFVRPNLG